MPIIIEDIAMRALAIAESILPIVMMFGLVMLIVPVVDLLYGYEPSYWFFVIGLVYSVTGFFALRLIMSKTGSVELTLMEALVTYSLVWIIIPLLTAIPLSMELSIPYIDALFESVSGFTGTGLTVLRGLDNMEKGIIIWRALMQWTGELGVVVFAAVFLPFFWRFGFILYSIERPSRISASLRETALRIFYIYFLVTAVGVIICIYLGVEPLDAVVHVMTSIATGGMSSYDSNFEKVYRYAPLSIYPITILMIIGGFNFVALSYILNGDLRRAWRIEEFRAFIYLAIVFTAVSLILALPIYEWSISSGLIHGSFNAISALTTTGLNIGNINELGSSIKLLLIVAMFVGSMSFSTAGGIKVVRFLVLLKKLKSYVLGYITGGEVRSDVRLGDEILEEREVSNILFFIVLHLTLILISAGLLKVMTGLDLLDTLFEATSAASNVGLSIGLTAPDMPVLCKLILVVLMYLGRLEYTALVVLIGLTLYKEHRLFVS